MGSKQRVVFRLCDAALELRTNEAEIVEFIRRFYHGDQSVARPDVRLNLEWRRSSSRRFEPPRLSEGWLRLGRWIFVRGGNGRDDAPPELICAFPGAGGLAMRFRWEGEVLDIEAVYRYSAPRTFARWLMNLHRDKRRRSVRQQLLHHILRFTMYYPLFWHLRRCRGLEVLHAGAVEVDGVGVVLAGLSGVGKSQIAFSLLSLEGTRFVSDNLLLFNNEKVFACPEPLRLLPSGLEALPNGGSRRLRELGGAEAFKCNRFKISPDETVGGVTPANLFFPCFAEKSFIREISTEEAVARLLATADPVGVMNDYRGFQSTLDLAFPPLRRISDRRGQLADLLKDVQCCVLGVRKEEEMEDVIERCIMPVISGRK